MDRIKTIGPEKCVVTLKIPFINKSSEMLEKKIRQVVRNTYYAANPRIVFTSKSRQVNNLVFVRLAIVLTAFYFK